MKFDESFGDLGGLKERILEEMKKQCSNDPPSSLLLENDYGRITLELRSEHYQFFFYAKDPFLPKPKEVSQTCSVISEEFPSTHGVIYEGQSFYFRSSIPVRIHQSILNHLETFQNEKTFLEQHGFRCLGYNWYENGDLQILKISHEGGVHFWFNEKFISYQNLGGIGIIQAIRLYAKDLDNYSTLPPSLRDWVANGKS